MKTVILIIHLVVLIPGQKLIAQEKQLIPFELKDQFDRVYSDTDFHDGILIIIGSDKNGSKYNEIWSKAISDSLHVFQTEGNIHLVGVADLRGVPFFLKGFVKGKFPKNIDDSILLDWKGALSKAYKFESEVSNILVFDAGKLVLKTYGTHLEDFKVKAVINKINNLIS